MLAKLELEASQFGAAAELYELGIEKLKIDRFALPESDSWLKGLAAAQLKLGQTEKLTRTLEQLARLDGDDSTIRVKLAELAASRNDFAASTNCPV